MKRVFNFAMPFLQASLVKQILVGLVLGIALAYAAPAAAVSCGFLGTVFVTALKAVAPILVFVLVMSSIANQNLSGENLHIKPIIVLYLIGTFSAAIVAVVASFMFPTKLILTATDAVATTPAFSPGPSPWASCCAMAPSPRAKCSMTPPRASSSWSAS